MNAARYLGSAQPSLRKPGWTPGVSPCSAAIRMRNPASCARSDSSRACERVLVFSARRDRSALGLLAPPGSSRAHRSVCRWGLSRRSTRPELFKFIEHRDEAARENTELFAKGLLAEAVGLLDDPQNARVRRLEPERFQTLPSNLAEECAPTCDRRKARADGPGPWKS